MSLLHFLPKSISSEQYNYYVAELAFYWSLMFSQFTDIKRKVSKKKLTVFYYLLFPLFILSNPLFQNFSVFSDLTFTLAQWNRNCAIITTTITLFHASPLEYYFFSKLQHSTVCFLDSKHFMQHSNLEWCYICDVLHFSSLTWLLAAFKRPTWGLHVDHVDEASACFSASQAGNCASSEGAGSAGFVLSWEAL